MDRKTLCVVTGTRAEYGLLRPVLQKLAASGRIETRLAVTGAHLSPAFGETVREIEADGQPIHARIDILKFGTGSAEAMARTVAYAIEAFTGYFVRSRPDAVLVLGDRYEIFAVGAAAAMLRIPLAHISGGDVTRGAADDWFRHCLTKMASLHFPSCGEYARRLIRMGEDPATVENVGGLGDENLRKMQLLSREALAESLGLDLSRPYVLVTYHPETASGGDPVAQFDALWNALAKEDVFVLFTKANADAGGAAINARMDALCAAHPEKAAAFTSLGVLRYLSAMKYCAAVIGNSSSGVVETPSLGVPAVNIGQRQAGRILCENVLCCAADEDSIRRAVKEALTPAFRQKAAGAVSPYNGGDTSGRIVRRLEAFLDGPQLGQPKCFYDGEDGAWTP